VSTVSLELETTNNHGLCDPPQLPHFSTDFNETQNQERYTRYDPTGKIWLM